jgi:hypothetical protein
MSILKTIRKVLSEQSEDWVEVSPDEYNDLLKYVNGDGAMIKKLPQYRGKKIVITGTLKLDSEVSNIDSIDYVNGSLDLGSSQVPYFDKSKVRGSFSYWHSKMYRLEREKLLKVKREIQEELREEGAWNIENGEKVSEETEAIFDHLLSRGIIEEGEDKYNLYKEKYQHYGKGGYYTWLGEDKFESEWIVYADSEIEDAAYEKLESDIEQMGYEAFYSHVWEDHLDDDQVRRWLYDDFEEAIRDSPEDWNIGKELSRQQEKYVEIYEKKISDLKNKLNTQSLSEEQISQIEDDIYGAEQLIEDIKENPEGDYSEDDIEDAIESQVDEYADDFVSFVENRGYDKEFILDFVDMDELINYVIRSDGYGNILNGYDGNDDEYKINDTWYHVMRYN